MNAENTKTILLRIDVLYREASGLPLHIQAYCMRSEAKVALGLESVENWNAELDQIQSQYPAAKVTKLPTVELTEIGHGAKRLE